MSIKAILEGVKNQTLTPEQAECKLACLGFSEMGFAKLDSERKARTGFAEVVFCQGKDSAHLVAIFKKLYEMESRVLGTRCSPEQYEALKAAMPSHLQYDCQSRVVKIDDAPLALEGLIAVCTAGTADIAVAEECAQTAEFFGTRVARHYDVGVSGIHRLLAKIDEIKKAHCVVAIAGMEGALASVIAGMVANPVVAVPTSVGYGASFHGLSALLTMINSCANGISVVNIDNGFGAAYIASQINRLAEKA